MPLYFKDPDVSEMAERLCQLTRAKSVQRRDVGF